jgi:hypothetical protein
VASKAGPSCRRNIAEGEQPRYLQLINRARLECRLPKLVGAPERNRDDLRGQPA